MRKPRKLVPPLDVQYTIAPDACAGATAMSPVEPVSGPDDSVAPMSVAPRIVTVIG